MNKEVHVTHIEFPATEKMVGEQPVVIPESFFEALKREKPDGINWDRVDAAVSVLKGEKDAVAPKLPEPEPTESQKFWRKMFDKGDQELYNRQKGPVKFDALKEAFANPASKSIGEHIMAIDKDFRGGRDAGDVKERLQRISTLLGVLGLFTAFDWGTSKAIEKPFNKIFPIFNASDKQYMAMREALKKVLEVMNDKYASVLGNMLIEKLTGKRGFIHEVADKGADTITVGIDGWDDWVNGSTLESAQRILFQIPIAGALLEQGLTRLSMFQEKSPLHTVTGKMIYMGFGVLLRELEVGKRKYDRRQTTFFDLINATSKYKRKTKPWGNGKGKNN